MGAIDTPVDMETISETLIGSDVRRILIGYDVDQRGIDHVNVLKVVIKRVHDYDTLEGIALTTAQVQGIKALVEQSAEFDEWHYELEETDND